MDMSATSTMASMSMTSSMSMASATSTSTKSHSSMSMEMGVFHWDLKDTGLWLSSWIPTTHSALVGACFGLFFVSFFSRTLPALEAYFVAWKKLRDNRVAGNHHVKKDIEDSDKLADNVSSVPYNQAAYPSSLQLPSVPAFSWSTDIIRSFITAVNAFVGYLLMMAVMTGHGAYFLVVVLGILFGEIAFGRFRSLNDFADEHIH